MTITLNSDLLRDLATFIEVLQDATNRTGIQMDLGMAGPVYLELDGEYLPVKLTNNNGKYEVVES